MSESAQEFDVWAYIARMGVKLRPARDTFFLDGDAVCAMRTCQYITQVDCEEFLHKDYKEFSCAAPGCQAKFLQLIDSEAHYNAVHRHSCSVCKKSFPTAYLLELHVTEMHDSFFKVLSAKEPSFECFLEKCPLKFWDPHDRRQHSINDHSFPSDFKFDNAERVNPKKKDKEKSKKNSTENQSSRSTSTSETVDALSSMEIDTTPVNIKTGQKSQLNEVRLRQTNSPREFRKMRPASALIVSETKGPISNKESASSCSSRTPPAYHRRLSLNTTGKGKSVEAHSPPVKRGPISLARMGERMSYCGSSVDVSSLQNIVETSQPISSSVSTNAIHNTGTFPRSRIPSPTKTFISSTSNPVSYPSTPKRQSVPSLPTTPKRVSLDESPSKSRIPVLRSSSYRVPKHISFGFGVPKVFPRKESGRHWHQANNARKAPKPGAIIENTKFDAMKMALD